MFLPCPAPLGILDVKYSWSYGTAKCGDLGMDFVVVATAEEVEAANVMAKFGRDKEIYW